MGFLATVARRQQVGQNFEPFAGLIIVAEETGVACLLTLNCESDSYAGEDSGSDMRTGELFSYVDLKERVPRNHPLRLIRRVVNEVLSTLDRAFAHLYTFLGEPPRH